MWRAQERLFGEHPPVISILLFILLPKSEHSNTRFCCVNIPNRVSNLEKSVLFYDSLWNYHPVYYLDWAAQVLHLNDYVEDDFERLLVIKWKTQLQSWMFELIKWQRILLKMQLLQVLFCYTF